MHLAHTTFLLIPGAGGSAWFWHLLVPRLEAQGHRALAVPLPAADDSAGLPEYAAAVVQAAEPYRSDHLVLVAHSLAGFAAPLVCQQLPVTQIILLNAMIPLPGERPADWWRNTAHAEARQAQLLRDGRPADAPFDLMIDFFHDVPRAVVQSAVALGMPRQSPTALAAPCGFTDWPRIPTRVLVGHDDRFFPRAFQHQVAQDRLGLAAEDIAGGHLVALSQPDGLAARLGVYASPPAAA